MSKKTPTTPKTEDITSVLAEQPVIEIIDQTIVIPEQLAEQIVTTDTEPKIESVPEAIPPHPPSPGFHYGRTYAKLHAVGAIHELPRLKIRVSTKILRKSCMGTAIPLSYSVVNYFR
ncbi:hypothetical protein [Nostoc sp. KVJ3]|uniref:hypothetical protein n=1 Tax=Nostoc sp. KVJ3 TaxID=457945 RepID=UPI002238381D|nr:hypothetical protein [Nostoc sp. KVJ3]